MKIRQYTAATMQEAILKIKVDLGPDAVILHQRKVKRGGFMGMFAQDMVEVLAAIDPNDGKGNREDKSRGKSQERPARQPSPYNGVERPQGNNDAWREAAAENWAGAAGGVSWEPSPAARQAQPAQAQWNGQGRDRSDGIDLGPLAAAASQQAPVGFAQEAYARAPQHESPRQAPVHQAAQVVERAVAAAVAEPPAAPQPVAQPASVTPLMPEAHPLQEEVQDLKSTVDDLKAMLVTIAGQLEMQPRSAQQFPTKLQKVFDRLLACDVDPSIARGLVVYLQREQPHLDAFEDLVDALEKPIGGLFQTAGPVTAVKGEQKIVALVGPTGVGKTTTIAKLAAAHALSREVRLAMLTIDTYRVAAIEQLKTYGDIIGLPVEVVLTPQSLRDALKLHGEKELILIDTAGRSPYNKMHLNELRSFLDIPMAKETHLVLSATTRLADLKQIVRNFAATGVDRLIFTKTDETDSVGGIISIAHETGLPVSYITTGQSVPDDILVAEGPALARMLVQELKA